MRAIFRFVLLLLVSNGVFAQTTVSETRYDVSCGSGYVTSVADWTSNLLTCMGHLAPFSPTVEGVDYIKACRVAPNAWYCVQNQKRTVQVTVQDCPSYTGAENQPVAQPSGCSCPSGTAWFPYGGCRKRCGVADNELVGGGADYYISKSSSSFCAGGCDSYPSGQWVDSTDGKNRWTQMASTGWACKATTNTNTQPDDNTPKLDPDKKKPPVCGATDGVMTSSSGKVLCVPEGTPDARKPQVQKTESKATGTNGEVTTTEKTTTRDPYTGATATNTTTTSASGTTSTATNSGGNGTGAPGGGGDNSGAEPGQCAKEPDSPMCRKGTVKEKGKYSTDQDGKLQEAKEQLTAKFNEIKSALSAAMASSATSGGGSLPCPAPITVLGKPISVCIADYADKLSVIGGIIVFAASIIAILLVVTA